jgi:hypothetical protein
MPSRPFTAGAICPSTPFLWQERRPFSHALVLLLQHPPQIPGRMGAVGPEALSQGF